MTKEELLKDPNARSIIEWAYRTGRYDEAYDLAINKDGMLVVGVMEMPLQKYKNLIVNSNPTTEAIIESIGFLRGD